MALTVEPPALGMQAQSPTIVKPVDLQPALDRLHNAYREGLITSQDIQKRMTVGNTDAEAQRAQNEAAKAKAEQDRMDQEGGKGYTKPGLFSRLTGIGTGPKIPPVGKPGAGAATGAVAGGMAGSLPAPATGGMGAPAIPAPALSQQTGPYSQAATLAPDFNPSHESTDDLLNLVGEAGYTLFQ